jgi:hypothetical protein
VSLPTTKRKTKQLMLFDQDENNLLLLDNPSKMMARVMKPLVRQFMAAHYSK